MICAAQAVGYRTKVHCLLKPIDGVEAEGSRKRINFFNMGLLPVNMVISQGMA